MNFNPRKILLFALQFFLTFLVFLWLYSEVLPAYQRGVLNLANPVLEHLSPPMFIEIDPKEIWDIYLLTPRGERLLLFTLGGDYLNLFYFNLAFLPALLLATPLKFSGRLLMLGWGLLLLFAIHVFSTIGYFRAEFCFYANPRNFFCNWSASVLGTGGPVFAVALWGLLTWHYWFPKPAPVSTPHTRRRKARS